LSFVIPHFEQPKPDNDGNAGISADEGRRLILAKSGPELQSLLDRAAEVRTRFFGKAVGLCAIANAKSGACSEDCAFCAQSSRAVGNGVPIHALLPARELTERAETAEKAGATHFSIVTSGRRIGSKTEISELESALRAIAQRTALHRCASLGLMEEPSLRRLQEAGLQRFHHNLETARSFFSSICTTHSFDQKLDTIRAARAVGLSVCSGGILGMGETPEQRVELAETLRRMGVDAVPINFLDARPGTPLERQPRLTPGECLATIAVYRLMLPRVGIVVMGGREAQLGDLQPAVFRAGATATIIGDYLTKSGSHPHAVLDMVARQGFSPSRDPAHN
jgi:biotin synthase